MNDFSKLRPLSFWQAGVLYAMISESEGKKGIFFFDCNSNKRTEVYSIEKIFTPSEIEGILHLTVLIFHDNELVENILPIKSAKKVNLF